mgnify:CR=1 FL=1
MEAAPAPLPSQAPAPAPAAQEAPAPAVEEEEVEEEEEYTSWAEGDDDVRVAAAPTASAEVHVLRSPDALASATPASKLDEPSHRPPPPRPQYSMKGPTLSSSWIATHAPTRRAPVLGGGGGVKISPTSASTAAAATVAVSSAASRVMAERIWGGPDDELSLSLSSQSSTSTAAAPTAPALTKGQRREARRRPPKLTGEVTNIKQFVTC